MEAQATIAAARRRLDGADIVVLACMALAALLAWLWLVAPAEMAMDVTPRPWSAAYLGPAFVMWALTLAMVGGLLHALSAACLALRDIAPLSREVRTAAAA